MLAAIVCGSITLIQPLRAAGDTAVFPPLPIHTPLEKLVGKDVHIDIIEHRGDGTEIRYTPASSQRGIDGRLMSIDGDWLTIITEKPFATPDLPEVHVPMASVKLIWCKPTVGPTTQP